MADKIGEHNTYAAEAIRSDVDRAVFLGDAHIDNLTTAMIAMGAELWALRRRVNTMETLMDQNGAVTKVMVEQYQPSEEEDAAWEAERQKFVERVFGVFARQADAERRLDTPFSN